MLEAEAILERIDRCIRDLEAIRAALMPPAATSGAADADDSTDALIDTTSAAARFGYSRDSIIRWCRQGCGRKVGGRWLADPRKLRAHINGG